MDKRSLRWPALLAAVLVAGAMAPLAPAEQYQAVSLPCNDVTINFTRPGRVQEVPVKEGERVKAGQLLAKLDASEEEAALIQDKAKAEDNTKVDAQKAIRDQRAADLRKIQHAFDQGGVGPFELDEAKLSLVVEEAKVKLTDFEHQMDKLKMQQTQVVVNKMQIRSPIDGRIEKRYVKVGESAEPSSKVVRVVDLTKLHVDTPVLYAKAIKLKEGDTGVVTFSDKSTATGKITFISGVADAGAGTLTVRLEVENDWKRPAGDQVFVEFPSIAKAATK